MVRYEMGMDRSQNDRRRGWGGGGVGGNLNDNVIFIVYCAYTVHTLYLLQAGPVL
jgi:hypothetical protein